MVRLWPTPGCSSLGLTGSPGPRAGRGRTCCSCSPSLPGSLPTGPHPARQPHYCPAMTLSASEARGRAKGEFPHSPSPTWCGSRAESSVSPELLVTIQTFPVIFLTPRICMGGPSLPTPSPVLLTCHPTPLQELRQLLQPTQV